MIAYLKGKVVEKTPVMVVLDCGFIGLEIRVPMSTYEKLPLAGNETSLHIHFHLAEDDIKFYGFHTLEEKELFKLLISVNGIGPKIALSILSYINWQSFIKHIRSEDDKSLTLVPGLGKKTAQRLILELRDKIEKMPISGIDMSDSGISLSKSHILNEAESALVTLGYKLADIRKAFSEIDNSEGIETSEQLIKQVIKMLYKKK